MAAIKDLSIRLNELGYETPDTNPFPTGAILITKHHQGEPEAEHFFEAKEFADEWLNDGFQRHHPEQPTDSDYKMEGESLIARAEQAVGNDLSCLYLLRSIEDFADHVANRRLGWREALQSAESLGWVVELDEDE